ncbi:MAG TPA: YfiR family protein [Planctomycetota bacterium]|nr:YfiR family protein [Planctomycetota bacterium]
MLLAALGLMLGLAHGSSAAPARVTAESAQEGTEYKVKAASLYHFINYTTWPKEVFEDERSPVVLLVLGEDPFGKALDELLKGKKAGGRSIRVLRAETLEKLPRAHMVFLAQSHAKELPALLKAVAGTSALVVGDSEGQAEQGAHVSFFVDSKRVGFAVNVTAVKRSKLTISPEMLKLARIIEEKQNGDGR